jgi:hypothetical protein
LKESAGTLARPRSQNKKNRKHDQFESAFAPGVPRLAFVQFVHLRGKGWLNDKYGEVTNVKYASAESDLSAVLEIDFAQEPAVRRCHAKATIPGVATAGHNER